jgi:hypothetical protein
MTGKNQSQQVQEQGSIQKPADLSPQGLENLAQSLSPAAAIQRVMAAPPPAVNPDDILTLQRNVGNRVVRRLLSGKRGPPAGESTIQRTPEVEAQLRRRFRPGDTAGIAERRQQLREAFSAVPQEEARALHQRITTGDLAGEFGRLATPVRNEMIRILQSRFGAAESQPAGGEQTTSDSTPEPAPQIDRSAIMADVDRQIDAINLARMGDMAPAAERFLSETRALIEQALDQGHFPVHDSWSRYGEIRPPGQGAEVTVRRPGDRISTVEGERAVVIAAELVYHRETSRTVSMVITSIQMRENSLLRIQGPRSRPIRRSGSPAQLETGQLGERLGELQGE